MLVNRKKTQQGLVMVVALIMLLAVTLMIVTASNLVQTNLKVVQNMESREQARFAAIAAIEEAMSSTRFTTAPGNVFAVSNCGVDNQRCYDINGNGEFDFQVRLEDPECVSVIPKKNSELNVFTSPKLATCFLPKAVYSMCAASVWEFEATATDLITGAEVIVHQGVSILTTLNNIDTACPV